MIEDLGLLVMLLLHNFNKFLTEINGVQFLLVVKFGLSSFIR